MNDLVVGLGEIGMPLYKLLKERNFKVDGYDTEPDKQRDLLKDHYEMVHICVPYSKDFNTIVKNYKNICDKLVIHSTVKEGTTKKIGAIYSPIRGTHNDMYENLKWFSKFYSSKKDDLDFQRRFPNCIRVDDSTKLETSKLVDTTLYGMYISLQKYMEINHPYYREFGYELHQKYGNKPIFYNDHKPISGHCIIPNADLLDDKFLADFIRSYV